MNIRDRGKIKWQGAFFMPEHVKMLKEMKRDENRVEKPLLDEYQIEEFENKICFAMEFKLQIMAVVWEEGFEKTRIGMVHRLDEIYKLIYLETDGPANELFRIFFDDIVRIEVLE
ncbi:YolD-like family protein [Peribacillus sp. SCS-26]|uniref:YolD-like family protein n=1 Tax=Paraperibacillus marinus TaxID=3115295 RepID=UPI0039060288